MTDKAKKNKNEYIKSYKREKCVHICLQLNKKTDADIIERLSQVPNKCGYIKQLIREEIEEFEIVQGLKGGRVNESDDERRPQLERQRDNVRKMCS